MVLFTVMAIYSESVKSEGDRTFFFFLYLPNTPPSQTLRKMANPTSTREVTDSLRHDKPLWKSLAGVDGGLCYVWRSALYAV